MRRSPGFTAVVLLSLALGIGANTAMFTLINAALLRPLPVREPGRLVEFLNKYPGEPGGNGFSWQTYQLFRDQNHVFSGISGGTLSRFTVRSEAFEPEVLDGVYVPGNFFDFLGVKPAIGRLIAPEHDHVGAATSAVAVVSWSFWKSRFNLDPKIVGATIVVSGAPLTVIGVTPREFFGLQVGSRPDLWLPIAAEPLIAHPSRVATDRWGLALIARLKPGVSLDQARAEMSVLYQPIVEERARNSPDPLTRQTKLAVEPASAGLTTRWRVEFAKPLTMMMAVAALLLLLACINVASMLLARAAGRQREIAVRVSLGASRLRLVRQALTESVLLAAAGTLLGIGFAIFGTNILVRILTSGRVRVDLQADPDLRVLLFTAAVALLTGILFGLAPAWNAFTLVPAASMRESRGSGETRSRRLFGKSLVAAQVALSVLLLSAAGLFVRHLSNLEHIDLGFRRDHVLILTLDPANSGYARDQLAVPYNQLLQRMQAIPGVRSASLSGGVPLSGAGASRIVTVEDHLERPEDRRYISVSWIAPKYFETLGTSLLAGRDFTFEDRGRPLVAVVNQSFARHYFGNASAIGKHVTFVADAQIFEIVGVVRDAKYYEILEPQPRTVFVNAFQFPFPASQFYLNTAIDPAAVAPEARRTVRDSLKTVPVTRVTTLAEQIDASIVPERLIATLSGLFGALGALLAAIGLYGLLAYTVARRVNEIGIRMALGATRTDVTRMVLREALALVTAGLVVGVPLVIWTRNFAASLIHDLPVTGALPIVFAAVAMIAVALLAAYVPARRAAQVDPMEALRLE
jgi:predicted permease